MNRKVTVYPTIDDGPPYVESHFEVVPLQGHHQRIEAWRAVGRAVNRADGTYKIPLGMPDDWEKPHRVGRNDAGYTGELPPDTGEPPVGAGIVPNEAPSVAIAAVLTNERTRSRS